MLATDVRRSSDPLGSKLHSLPNARRISPYPAQSGAAASSEKCCKSSVMIKPGNRLRLTIGTANTLTDVPSAPTLGQELGGTITLLHGGPYSSSVLLPVMP